MWKKICKSLFISDKISYHSLGKIFEKEILKLSDLFLKLSLPSFGEIKIQSLGHCCPRKHVKPVHVDSGTFGTALFPAPDILGSNPVLGNFYLLPTVLKQRK